MEQLRSDFHGKCYIFENTENTTLNVEHRIPHEGDSDLKFDWTNLYWACGHCNNIKGNRFQPMLDCTDPHVDILSHIEYIPIRFPREHPTFKTLKESAEATNTVNFLNAVFNGTTILKSMEADSLRRILLREIKDFQDELIQYYEGENKIGVQERAMVRSRIERHLEAASPFAAFKRCIIRGNPALADDFPDCVA
ncbi:MAG: hypothetical protein ACI8T1_000456 [Verrucomicrobiales bacterium]